MENEKDKVEGSVLTLYAMLSGVFWLVLIGLKALDIVSLSWPTVLLGAWWIPLLLLVIVFVVLYVLLAIERIKRRIRDKQLERRIINQAKAIGVWDKRPIVLGGRALDLKAWEDFKIKRKPGEPDAHLRRRCMAAADNELAKTPTE